jgi:hypothetical protein
MRARSIVAAVAATVATTGLILFGTQTAGGQTVIHVVLPANSLTAKFIDVGRDGLRLGDRLAARGALLDEAMTDRIGTSYSECLVHRRIADATTGLYNCTYVLELADGEIMLKGLDPRGPSVSDFAVLGGTGAYASAAGDATFTDTDSNTGAQTDMVIRLSG